MTDFIDGPAMGKRLTLGGAPIMLQVVQGRDGKIDALDSPDDQPAPNEEVYLYIRVGPPGATGFIDGRDPKTGRRTGGMFASATYRLWPDQPAAEVLRDTAAFRQWCEVNRDALYEAHWAYVRTGATT